MRPRELSDLTLALARAAVAICAPCLREEERADAYHEFAAAFRDVLVRHEVARERERKRLGKSEPE
jgi:hypothetical protein